jgi:hypothetical protein
MFEKDRCVLLGNASAVGDVIKNATCMQLHRER